jgi:UDP:flavonoid glycosyltransferase YjiC (YdhE family)
VGLAKTLAERGRDVTVVVSEPFVDLVRRCGLESIVLGSTEEFNALASHPDLWHPLRGPAYVAKHGILPAMRRQFDLVKELHRPGETFLVGSALGFGCRMAHEALGAPLATVHLQPTMFWSEYVSPKLSKHVLMADWVPRWLKRFQYRLGVRLFLDRVLLDEVNAFRRELDLPPVASSMEMMHSPQRIIGMFPAWFAAPQPDWPPHVTLADFPLWDEAAVTPVEDGLAQFLDAGDPPIAFTPGSAMVNDRRFFEAAAEACRLLGRRGLFLTRHAAQVPSPLPAGVVRYDYAPFSQILGRCAALVHHGGIGTTAQALAAGAPQLIRPLSHDQPDNAARIKKLGVGDALWLDRFTAKRAADVLDRLLTSPAVAARCREVAGRFAGANGLAAAADCLEAEIRSARQAFQPDALGASRLSVIPP